jgi:hypothetical protein
MSSGGSPASGDVVVVVAPLVVVGSSVSTVVVEGAKVVVTEGADVVVEVWANTGRVSAKVVSASAAKVGTAARNASRDTSRHGTGWR